MVSMIGVLKDIHRLIFTTAPLLPTLWAGSTDVAIAGMVQLYSAGLRSQLEVRKPGWSKDGHPRNLKGGL